MEILPRLNIEADRLHSLSGTALAHIGDAVFELLARVEALQGGGLTAGGLHRATVEIVSASAQARAARYIEQHLTEKEAEVLRRGRNAHPRGVPKGASVADYRLSTALEALFGYLYLEGEHERILELFALCREGNDAA